MNASSRRCLECGKDIALRGHARGCPLGEATPTQPQEDRFIIDPSKVEAFRPPAPGQAIPIESPAVELSRRQVKALEDIATSLATIAALAAKQAPP